jgi:hypothetical protein
MQFDTILFFSINVVRHQLPSLNHFDSLYLTFFVFAQRQSGKTSPCQTTQMRLYTRILVLQTYLVVHLLNIFIVAASDGNSPPSLPLCDRTTASAGSKDQQTSARRSLLLLSPTFSPTPLSLFQSHIAQLKAHSPLLNT